MSQTTLLLDAEPITGAVRRFHCLPDDQYAVETETDVEPVMEAAKTLNRQTSDYGPSRWKGDWHLVANMPMVIWSQLRQRWAAQGLSRDERQAALKRWLNAPENSVFRAKPGRV